MLNQKNAQVVVPGFVAIVVIALLLHVTGIGCPIKFATGVSCPGCGLTRAWLSVLELRLDLAFAYHPLFWAVPLAFAVECLKDRMPPRLYRTLMIVLTTAFVVIWLIRLTVPAGSKVLSSDILSYRVVSIDEPGWLHAVRMLLQG